MKIGLTKWSVLHHEHCLPSRFESLLNNTKGLQKFPSNIMEKLWSKQMSMRLSWRYIKVFLKQKVWQLI